MHIGYCGIQCHGCQVYKATFTSDPVQKLEMQKQIAEAWSKNTVYTFEAEQMVCEGCTSERLCGYCSRCEMRKCARLKELPNCKECGDFPCEKITSFRKNSNLPEEMKFVF